MTQFTEWRPIKSLLFPDNGISLTILNQPIRDDALFRHLWKIAKIRIAADGGANQIYELGQATLIRDPGISEASSDLYKNLDTIIGDLDSLTDGARDFFTARNPDCQVIHDPDQYSTDFTKAVRHARQAFPGRDIVCVGGLGGRVDQGLSQLHHLYMFQRSPAYAEGRMFLLSGESLTFLLKSGKHRICVREREDAEKKPLDATAGLPVAFDGADGELFAKYVGIIPIREPSVITTKGLEWDVQEWPTEFGGQMSTSNHVLPKTEVVEIETTKDVLFTIALNLSRRD